MRWSSATSRGCLLGALGTVVPAAGQEPEEPIPDAPRCDLRLEGTVTDALFGEVVPGADVVVLDTGRHLHRTVTTDAGGAFAVDGLCPGPHRVRVAAPHHEPLEQEVVLPAPFVALELHGLDVPEIVVVGTPHGTEDTRSATVLSGEALARTRGHDLAETVAQVPGVVVQRGGADTAKPVVRGQVERRVLTLFDGVRHEGQKWGADHAPEIDPFAAHRLVVVKGAAGVRHGPDALGGVLLVEPRPLRTAPGFDGEVHAVGVTNGLRGTLAVRLDGAHAEAPGLAWRVEANASRGASLRAPGHVLGNTASGTWNAGATLGWTGGRTRLVLSYRHHAFDAGVFYGLRAESPTDLAAALAREVPEGADRWRVSYAIDRPSQHVDHDTLLARAAFDLDAGELVATYAFQHDHRVETEPVRGSVTVPQHDFTLRTHTLDVSFAHRRAHVGRANVQGTVGVSGQVQENVYAGLPLIPNYRAGDLGIFAHERLWTGRFEVEAGARYDHRRQTAWLTADAFRRHAARGTLGDGDCDGDGDVVRCPRAFHAGSASVGALVRAVPDLLRLKLDLSSAARFPDVDELYVAGTAPTLPVFAVGDPHLGTETAYGASLTAELDHAWVAAEVSGHGTFVDDFVLFAPAFAADGAPAVEVLSRGTFPRFDHRARDAWFYGVDGFVTVAPAFPVSLTVQGALVRGRDAADGTHLPFVPADRVGGTLTWRPPRYRALVGSHLSVSGQYVARARVDPALDLAPPPDPYALLGASAGFEVQVPSGTLEIGLEGTNLTNTRYRESTSLLRYYADEPGWDLRLRLTWRFERPALETR